MATKKNASAKAAEAKPAEAEEKPKVEEKPEAAETTEVEEKPEAVIASVTHRFRDRETGSVFQPGAIIAVSPERFEEICAAGDFLERA